MKMRRGDQTGRTGVADQITFANANPALDAGSIRAQMRVARDQTIGVGDRNNVSILLIGLGAQDDACTCGADFSAFGGSEVDAGMFFSMAEDRVVAIAVPAGDRRSRSG